MLKKSASARTMAGDRRGVRERRDPSSTFEAPETSNSDLEPSPGRGLGNNQTCAGLQSPSRMINALNYDRTNPHSA